MRNLGILWAAALVLGGCGGMSANECELADWRAVGYEDGARGRSADVFGAHRRDCAKHEVAPDFAAYQAGREAGLREYCQPSRGFREGARGVEYAGACPADLEAAFLDNYVEGRILYELESAVGSTRRQISSRKSRMNEIEQELTRVMTRTLAGDASAEERAALVVEATQLAEERIRLADEVDDLEVKLSREQEKLEAHRELVAGRS